LRGTVPKTNLDACAKFGPVHERSQRTCRCRDPKQFAPSAIG